MKSGQTGGSQSQTPPGQTPGASGDSLHSGSGTNQGVHIVDIEAHLKQLSTRNWGELPGTLKTELLDASRKRPDGDYAKLIRLYFEDISRRQTPAADNEAPVAP